MWAFLRDHNYKLSEHVSSNLLLAMVVIGTSVFTYCFETATLATVQAMPHYERTFGEINPATKKYYLSPDQLAWLNSFPLLFYALRVIVASLVSERFGRRPVFIFMNTVCIGGVFLALFAQNFSQALGGRLLIQMHVGMEGFLVPMLTAELVPPAIRGSMVGLYAFNHTFAGFIASIITNFISKIDSDNSWKIPIGIILVFPALALLLNFLIPESPRWLLRKNRFQEAVDNIYYLRSADKDYPAEQEATIMLETIHNATAQGKWKQLFQGTNKRRTRIGIMAAAATQLTGQSFASTYGTVFLKQLGTMDPFTATMIKRAGLVIGCIFIISTVEKIGRRRMCLVAGSFAVITLLVMGGLSTISRPKPTDTNTILAMTILFPVAYMVAFGSTMQIVKSEIPHTSLRDKSTMLHWSVANVCNFAATYTVPYLLSAPYANLGAKVGFVYAGTNIIFLVLAFLFMPEMTNRSLEEIDEMMESKVPAWRSRNWKAAGLGSTLTDIDNGKVHGVAASGKKAGDNVDEVHVSQVEYSANPRKSVET